MDEPFMIQQARAGDLDAFNRLVLAYQTRAYNLAYRVMCDQDAAADATQEAFLSAFRGLKRFRGGSFQAWLMRIVINACYDEIRKRKRNPVAALDALDIESDGTPREAMLALGSDVVGPEKATEQAELGRAIEDCIQQLPEDARSVIVLVDIQDYGYQEAAEIIGKPVGTIKSRLARARARMRDCLADFRELLPVHFRLIDERIS